MPDRLHILCAVPIASWVAGVYVSRYAGGDTVGLIGQIALLAAGLLAAPLVGVWVMRAIPDFFEWENSGPRDFFVPAVMAASFICFAVALLATVAFA